MPFHKLAGPFYKNGIRSVYHDLSHCLIIHQFLKHIQFADRIKQFLTKLYLFFQRKTVLPHPPEYQIIDLFKDFLIAQLSCKIQPLHQKRTKFLK
mgnify:CR=1 FL=1